MDATIWANTSFTSFISQQLTPKLHPGHIQYASRNEEKVGTKEFQNQSNYNLSFAQVHSWLTIQNSGSCFKCILYTLLQALLIGSL